MLLMEWNFLFRLNWVLHRIKLYNFNIFSALGEVLSFLLVRYFIVFPAQSIACTSLCVFMFNCTYISNNHEQLRQQKIGKT